MIQKLQQQTKNQQNQQHTNIQTNHQQNKIEENPNHPGFKTPSQTIYKANSCTTPYSLPLLDLDISIKRSSCPYLPIRALHDSGCAASIIKTSTFKKIYRYEEVEVTKHPDTFVISVTGHQTPVYGSATLFLRFNGDNGVVKKFPLKVYIHDDVEYDFLLGRDFTGSSIKVCETEKHLYLTDEPSDADLLSNWEVEKHKLCHVPLRKDTDQTKKDPIYSVYSMQDVTLQPMCFTNVRCFIKFADIPVYMKKVDDETPFIISNVTLPHTKTLENTLLSFKNISNITIPIFNDTLEEYELSSDSLTAEITLPSENYEMIPTALSHFTYTDFTQSEILFANQTSIRSDTITEDPILTEQEKEAAFYQYTKHGSYAIPMSTFIEQTPSITEMEYKEINNERKTKTEFLAQFNINHLPDREKAYAETIFLTHRDAFSEHDLDLGRANDIEMDILIDETKPRIQKFVPLPHNVRDQVRLILDQMIEFGIIRECDEPSLFCSNLLVTKKKDKSQIRILLDGRLLNNATIRLPTNLVTQMEVFSHLSGKKYVSTIDVSHAFFQVPLSKEAQPFTAFFSEEHGKRYCFNRAPQGLKNSPLYLKLLMDKLLGDMALTVIHYVDDILIATDKSLEHHLQIINEVLRRLKQGGIKIKPQKIFIATEEIEFLGVIYTKGTLHIPKARVKAFQEYPKPKTPKQVKSFVCAMSYYRRFIPHFAHLSQPLMELTQLHHKQFKWTSLHDKSFEDMIEALTRFTSLTLPDPSKPFYVQTDASDLCGAGRVFQKDDDGNELLLACVSRTFTRAEQKYGVFRKETLALLYCLKSMDFYLRFANKVIILIDAKAIIYLRMCKDSAGILLRFSLEISKYDAEIHHVQGITNEVSDALSRNNININEIIEDKKELNVLSEKETEHILKRLSIPDGRQFDPDEVRWLLEADSLTSPFFKKKPPTKAKLGKRFIKNNPQTLGERKVKLPKEARWRTKGVRLPINKTAIRCKNPETRTLTYEEFQNTTKLILTKDLTPAILIRAQKDDLFTGPILRQEKLNRSFAIIDGILFKKQAQGYKIALPETFYDAIINTKHYSVMGLHFSKTRILRDMLTRFYCNVSVLKKKIENITANCIICQFNTNAPKQHILQKTNFIYAPRASWACDIIPSLPQSNSGNTAIFLAVDMFTGYIQLQPIKSRQSEHLIEAVLNGIIRPFGSPRFIRSDSESGMFNSKEFHNFLAPLGIDFLTCSIGSPWSNGAAERAVQTVKSGLRKFVQQEKSYQNWDIHLHYFSQAHNSSCSIYGFSPEELHFGFTNPSFSDLFQVWPDTSDPSLYAEKIIPIAEENRRKSRELQEHNAKRQLTYRNKSRVEKSFKLGQIVLQKQLQLATGPGKALQPKFNGPYVIISLDDDKASCVIEHLHTGHQLNSHFSNIQLLNFDPKSNRASTNIDEDLIKMLPEKYSKDRYYGTRDNTPLSKNDIDLQIEEAELERLESMENNFAETEDICPINNMTQSPSTQFTKTIHLSSENEQKDPIQHQFEQNEIPTTGQMDHLQDEFANDQQMDQENETNANETNTHEILTESNPHLATKKEPPDKTEEPSTRPQTRSQTRLKASTASDCFSKTLEVQFHCPSGQTLSNAEMLNILKGIVSDKQNLAMIKNLSSPAQRNNNERTRKPIQQNQTLGNFQKLEVEIKHF